MEPQGYHRKLTAILSADVAGYSRLMQDDESAAVATPESFSLKTTLRLTLSYHSHRSTTWLGPASEIGTITRQFSYGWIALSSTRTAFSLLWIIRQPMN
jgi:hypothetical protein